MIYVPAGLGHEFMLRLVRGNTYLYSSTSGIMMVDCNEKEAYEDVFLTLDGHKFQITVDDYFLKIAAKDGGDDTCILGFVDAPK